MDKQLGSARLNGVSGGSALPGRCVLRRDHLRRARKVPLSVQPDVKLNSSSQTYMESAALFRGLCIKFFMRMKRLS